jgi:hypothetical protein
MFSDNGAGGVNFDTGIFSFRNNLTDISGNAFAVPFTSFLSDYIEFDISGFTQDAAHLPVLANGSFAGKLFVSGDNFAIGSTGTSGEMDILTTTQANPIVGNFAPQSSVSGRNTPGVYQMEQGNPTDLNQIAKIISLQGTWRDYQTVMSGFSSFEMITFPNIQDNNVQAIVIVQRSSTGAIANLYYGFLDFNAGKFQSFPINDIVTASVAGELDGTIVGYKTQYGSATTVPDAIRYGTYQFNSGEKLPSGFQSAGTFVVYRG